MKPTRERPRKRRGTDSVWKLPSGESLEEFVLRAGIEPPQDWNREPELEPELAHAASEGRG